MMSKKLKIEYTAVDKLTANPQNARTHSKKQIKKLAASIKEFGFNNPVLIDRDNVIIAGHGRVMAAKKIGLEQIPTLLIDYLTPEQIRAYMLADNQLALLSDWDFEILSNEFKDLANLDLGFDLEITGFDTAEIDKFIAEADKYIKADFAEIKTDKATTENSSEEVTNDDPAANIVPVYHEKYKPVSILGDIWYLGEHRIICGDSRNAETYSLLFGDKKAEMIFTDPPYNVPINGHVSGKGVNHHPEFAMASGEMSEGEFTDFLKEIFKNQVNYSIDGSIHYICMDWRHMYELLSASKNIYSEFKNLCVWNKNNAGMGTFYRSKHELVSVFKNGAAAHINNFELGQNGRYRTNVWNYRGINSFGKNKDDAKLHPTVKPVEMVADAILDCSKRDGIILDPFLGSGSTLIAAEKTGRICYGIEISPLYIDTAIERFP
jgi:DNA modification methylase